MTNFSYLNADDFKRWIKNHQDFDSAISPKSLVGLEVETKVSAKRLVRYMTVENGNPHRIAKEFSEDGGVIKEIDEEDYVVQVKSGTFQINRKYVII
jgi:hypothetical protein